MALSIRTDIVLQVGIDHATTVAGFGSSSLLLYLAVTLGTQRAAIYRRAIDLPDFSQCR